LARQFFNVDLTSEAQTRDLVVRVLNTFGRLDVLVHTAAFVGTTERNGWNVPFAQQSVAAWEEAMRVNLTSAFVLAQEAAPALIESGHGAIVLVSSIYGVIGPDLSLYQGTTMGNPVAYGASKGGLLQLTRYLATLLAPSVRVNALSPGGVLRGQPVEFVRRYEARTPLKRMAVEDDIKGAAAYLASDLSAYVTGQNLLVDGGFSAW
jgi:NAD(P)-dependent dehydrogenase (short-subunit alcohol dehydrogenase family)